MLILGSTSDDKGTQLEKLTQTLLKALGYENVVTNYIGTGGSEIDVRAEFDIPGLGKPSTTHRLICECKAHNKPNNTTDWLKFLGKVFIEEARTAQSVSGCFIALSGVNGNVLGSYEGLKKHRENITLVAGSDLLHIVTDRYSLCGIDEIKNSIHKYTGRQFRSTEIVYYEDRAYYVIVFEDEAYTILHANAEPLQEAQTAVLQDLIERVMSVGEYIDLPQEAEARQRGIMIQKAILSQLMVNDGVLCIEELTSKCNEYTQKEYTQEKYTQEEVIGGLDKLLGKKWVVKDVDNSKVMLLSDNQEDFYRFMVDVYRFLLIDRVYVEVLGCAYYDRYLNEQFVSEIQRIQGGIRFSAEEIQDIIQLLRLSPEAIAYATHPDPMITVHRAQEITPSNAQRVDENDRHYFLRNLYMCLLRNFELSGLKKYFCEVRGVVELETLQTIKTKSEKKIVLQSELQHRLRIGKLSEELGEGYALILLINDAPEPWEKDIETEAAA